MIYNIKLISSISISIIENSRILISIRTLNKFKIMNNIISMTIINLTHSMPCLRSSINRTISKITCQHITTNFILSISRSPTKYSIK